MCKKRERERERESIQSSINFENSLEFFSGLNFLPILTATFLFICRPHTNAKKPKSTINCFFEAFFFFVWVPKPLKKNHHPVKQSSTYIPTRGQVRII